MADDDDRPRRSWRDIDRGRDKSPQRREAPATGGARRAQQSQKSYRAALDRLFDSGRVGELVAQVEGKETQDEPTRAKLIRALSQAEDRASITAAVDAYHAQFGLPTDVDLLAKYLEHKRIDRQLEALRALCELVSQQQQPKRVRALIARLKLQRDTAEDPEIVELASVLLQRLE